MFLFFQDFSWYLHYAYMIYDSWDFAYLKWGFTKNITTPKGIEFLSYKISTLNCAPIISGHLIRGCLLRSKWAWKPLYWSHCLTMVFLMPNSHCFLWHLFNTIFLKTVISTNYLNNCWKAHFRVIYSQGVTCDVSLCSLLPTSYVPTHRRKEASAPGAKWYKVIKGLVVQNFGMKQVRSLIQLNISKTEHFYESIKILWIYKNL